MTSPAENIIGIKPWLWSFAENTVLEFNMDESHGMTHFVNTVLYLRMILEDFANETIIEGMKKNEEIDLLTDAAFAHDLIDRKYMNEAEGLQRLKTVFMNNGYTPTKFAIIQHIITTMSYSKRIKRRRDGLPMIEPGPYALAVAIVVDADQLDGYDPERCRIYQETKFRGPEYQHLDESERIRLSLGWRRTILEKRVLRYQSDCMNTNIAKKLAEPLHNKVAKHIEQELAKAEIFDY